MKFRIPHLLIIFFIAAAVSACGQPKEDSSTENIQTQATKQESNTKEKKMLTEEEIAKAVGPDEDEKKAQPKEKQKKHGSVKSQPGISAREYLNYLSESQKKMQEIIIRKKEAFKAEDIKDVAKDPGKVEERFLEYDKNKAEALPPMADVLP
ncbi:MAG: hypothetical protein HZA01_12845 [Nitrospinae bacterium]|nr:hypothetical protein [Nitrospinota bacterium]